MFLNERGALIIRGHFFRNISVLPQLYRRIYLYQSGFVRPDYFYVMKNIVI